jgi:hypothetical protein
MAVARSRKDGESAGSLWSFPGPSGDVGLADILGLTPRSGARWSLPEKLRRPRIAHVVTASGMRRQWRLWPFRSLGSGAPISKFDLKRDTGSGRLVIVEKTSQRVVEVTDFEMGSG